MSDTANLRRPPPDFRRAVVANAASRTPRLATVTIEGPELVGFSVSEPAASLRLLLPRGGTGTPLELPTWNGNEFRFADGERPPIRTLTPLRADPAAGRIDVEVVLHGEGALSTWARAQPVGDEVAVSGPGRGYEIDTAASRYLLVGDESAVPAIGQLLEVLPGHADVEVVIEIGDTDAQVELPAHPGANVRWCELAASESPGAAMVREVESMATDGDERVWAAGEAAGVQRLRTLLLKERGLPRSQAVIRGYWKHGRTGAG